MRPLAAALAFIAALALAACGDDGGPATTSPPAVTSVAASIRASPLSSPAPTASPFSTSRFQLTTLVADAQVPLALAWAPDGRLFYNERAGGIRIVRDGRLQAQPFATLDVLTDGEHGLLGLALDPDFAANHYLYAFYSSPEDADGPKRQKIVRFTDQEGAGAEETVIVDNLPISESNHNGGRIKFGPDGELYVTIGDTTDSDTSQDTGVLAGKVLRYNADGSVPRDNPIAGSPVWAWGLRNTFGLSFAPDGTLYATDNSDTGQDEIDRIVRGGNYGWPDVRGVTDDPRYISALTDSGDESWAPTGLAAASDAPTQLFFCSYNRGHLLHIADAGATVPLRVADTEQPCSFDVALGPDGALYLADAGAIYRWGP